MHRLLLFSIGLSFFVTLGHTQIPDGDFLFGALRARQIGPAVMSGRVSSIDVVNRQTEILYVGSAGGGVWKSISGGVAFRPVFDDHTMSIGKVAIDQQHPDTVWVGTGEPWPRNSVSVGDGIYRTTDGGTSWEHLGLEKTERIADILIHPDDPNTVYVAALGHLWNANPERGVFRTTDGGQSWEKIFYIDENTGAADLAMDPRNPDVLYAAMWSFRRWPWRFDSGFTGGSGLFKSTDGGATWKELRNGLPEGKLGRLAVAVAPGNGDVVYLSVECEDQDGKGIYLSTDAGASWSLVNNEFNSTVRPFYFSNLIVDPQNDSIVIKCGLTATISEDRGDRFRSIDGSVHSDVHDAWIDPNNPKHIIVATDGGVYQSFDRGYTFSMMMDLPISQFYHVSVDMAEPYNVYGGLQDNGSWYAPSRKAGGISNSDWKATYGGDGFYSFAHPTDPDVVYAEYQGGQLVRYNKKTGQAKDIKPYPEQGEAPFRFNWNAPIALSNNNPDRLYFGAQYLFVSDDRGDSWRRLSPDLTTNDPEKQKQEESGGLSIDNSTAENHCTIYTIAESPVDERTIWAGADDGNLQVTTDGGKTWRNVAENAPDLPANTWVTFVEPGHFDARTAYVTFDGHRTGDMTTYLYRTTDAGQTWRRLNTPTDIGYALCVREDLVNPNLLFLGTEFGLYISADGGERWSRFKNNMPKVGVRDMVIHPRDHALVMGAHGRGVIILDDITPLRQMTAEIAEQKLHFFATEPTVLRDPGAGGSWFGGSGNFRGPNPSTSAQIVYYMQRRHTFGKMFIEVWKDGEFLKTLPAGKSAGINVVNMPTALPKPKAPPTKNTQALFGSLFGPNLQAGAYDVLLIKGRDTFQTQFVLEYDPDSPYELAGRELQRTTAMRLYDLSEHSAWRYALLNGIAQGARAVESDDEALRQKMETLAEKAETLIARFVSLEGDGYVADGEELYERISNLYRLVSGFPGRPSDSQVARTDALEQEMIALDQEIEAFLGKELKTANAALTAAGFANLAYPEKTAFLEGESTGGQRSSGPRWKTDRLYRTITGTPLGEHWINGWK